MRVVVDYSDDPGDVPVVTILCDGTCDGDSGCRGIHRHIRFNTDELKALAYIFHTAHQRLTREEAL